MTTFTDEIRETVSPHKFGGDRMAAALYLLSMDGGQDEETGSVEWDVWVARFGRRLLLADDRGFVWQVTLETEAEAKAAFTRADEAYAEWDTEGDLDLWSEDVLLKEES